jgi:cell division protein FtsB
MAVERPRLIRLRRSALKGFILLLLAAGIVLLFTILGVIPVRAYVVQRHELDASRARLEMLSTRNSVLTERAQVLGTDVEMQRLALDQFGMVRPGERLTVIPGLRSEGSVLDAARPDTIVGPAPSATQAPRLSRVRAVFDAIQFWR